MKKFKFVYLSLLILFSLLAFSGLAVSADQLNGTIIKVYDGDTVTLLTNNKEQVRIRLAEIDAPEAKQPYGKKAQQELSSLIFGKEVIVIVNDKDRYGRYIGHINIDGTNANKRMIELGAAWVYRDYLQDNSLIDVEEHAKQMHLGLWKLPQDERIEPWHWRKIQRENRK